MREFGLDSARCQNVSPLDSDSGTQALAPAKLESGVYDVSVTRKGKDIYRADGTGTYIVTRYCYEYAYSERAVLRYTGIGTIGAGQLSFTR